MYSSEDFSDLDKTNFKAYRFPDNSIYYGEVAYVDQDNKIVSDPNALDEEERTNLKLVRHGPGAQFYGVNQTSAKCQYEGEWVLDKMQGKGAARFSDGSSYEGEFLDGKFSGIGKFIWKIGHVYIGAWKDGKMEGEGEFKHQDGHILRGTFNNNYIFDKDINAYLDPFLSSENADKFKNDHVLYINMNKTSK